MKQEISLPLTLNRHRIYIFPTLYGFLFIGVLFAMLVGSINYNNNLGFLLVFLLGGIALISMLHTYRNLLGLVVLSISVDSVFAGDMALFRILVRSGPARERTAVVAAFSNSDTSIEDIPADTDARIDIKAETQVRGIFRPGRLTLWSRFPLSLFRAWAVLDMDLSCIVYPKPVAGRLIHTTGAGDVEADGGKQERGADDFAGLKQYRPGDPVRQIAWKSLSRGLGVFSKDFEGDGRAAVVFDYHAMDARDPEVRLSRICDMVLKAHNMNIEYGLALPGKTISPGKGDRHKHQCLKALALFGRRAVDD